MQNITVAADHNANKEHCFLLKLNLFIIGLTFRLNCLKSVDLLKINLNLL